MGSENSPTHPGAGTNQEPPPGSRQQDTIQLSRETVLRTLRSGASQLGISLSAFSRLLSELNIPTISFGRRRYYNTLMLELALHALTYFRMPSFAAPGSRDRNRGTTASGVAKAPPVDFPSDDLLKDATRLMVNAGRAANKTHNAAVERLLKDQTRRALRK